MEAAASAFLLKSTFSTTQRSLASAFQTTLQT